MKNDIEYRGLNNYTVSRDIVKIRNIVIFIIFVATVCGTLFLKLRKEDTYENKEINIISASDIQYYIDICDEESSGKAQINWQEIAAIWIKYKTGEIKIDYNFNIDDLCKLFLIQNNSGYEVNSLDNVLEVLGVNSKDKKNVKGFLATIEKNALYNNLYLENDKTEFIKLVADEAMQSYKKYEILPSITIGQAILESGWGKSELAVNYNNLFGIKADSRWDGAVATIVTSENYNDIITANFRKYKNIYESIEDHGQFLYENTRYTKSGLFEAKDYISQAQSLEDAGYSTAKNEAGEAIYADKLIGIIQKYNLMLYDTEVLRN